MPLGSTIRGLLGPAEPAIARLYRGAFTDLESIASTIAAWTPADRILEIGCGEGQLTEELTRAFPRATITGIDITPRVGRLYRGPQGRATFLHRAVAELAAERRGAFDLAIVADVLHHMPWAEHAQFLRDAAIALAPGGRLALKDWERRANLPHLFGYLSDRVITNDRVRYASAEELRELLRRALPQASVEREVRLRPWANNLMFLVRGAA